MGSRERIHGELLGVFCPYRMAGNRDLMGAGINGHFRGSRTHFLPVHAVDRDGDKTAGKKRESPHFGVSGNSRLRAWRACATRIDVLRRTRRQDGRSQDRQKVLYSKRNVNSSSSKQHVRPASSRRFLCSFAMSYRNRVTAHQPRVWSSTLDLCRAKPRYANGRQGSHRSSGCRGH
jgi:hypothetical protein